MWGLLCCLLLPSYLDLVIAEPFSEAGRLKRRLGISQAINRYLKRVVATDTEPTGRRHQAERPCCLGLLECGLGTEREVVRLEDHHADCD